MCVQIIGDSKAKLAAIGNLIGDKLPVASELLSKARVRGRDTQAVVVAADLRDVNNISALKNLSDDLSHVSKRVFLIDHHSRLAIVQAYALGATSVLTNPVTAQKLLKELLTPGMTVGDRPAETVLDSEPGGSRRCGLHRLDVHRHRQRAADQSRPGAERRPRHHQQHLRTWPGRLARDRS